jgi:hypothetical protein
MAMGLERPLGRRGWLLGCGLLAMGCTPQVETRVEATGPLPRPERYLVHGFAIHPGEVQLDSGLRGRLTQAFSAEPPGERQVQAARQVSAAVTTALVEALRAAGLPAESVSGLPAGRHGPVLLLDGQVLGVDEGNQTRRRLVGFGSGMSSVEVTAQAWLLERGGRRRAVESFVARADSGHMPGAAATMGVGALTGRMATSAAIGGAGQLAMGRAGDDLAEARRLGQAIAAQLRDYAARQGWA